MKTCYCTKLASSTNEIKRFKRKYLSIVAKKQTKKKNGGKIPPNEEETKNNNKKS